MPYTKKNDKPEVKEVVATYSEKPLSTETFDGVEVARRLQGYALVAKVIKDNLVNGVDYGIIPNTGDKPTLFKAGAQKIARVFGLTSKVVERIHETFIDDASNTEHWYYEYKIHVFDKDGNFISEGIGSANTQEKNVGSARPVDMRNTKMKIARKRAFVDAISGIGNIAELFTQDLDDGVIGNDGKVVKKLSKDLSNELYSIVNMTLMSQAEGKNELQRKAWIKEHLFNNVFPKLGIEKPYIAAFDTEDARKLKEWIKSQRKSE